jgi:hypothetical protein
MKNVAHNGFCCPYCRTLMAEAVNKYDDDDDDDDDDSESDSDDDSHWSEITGEIGMFQDYALRGFRFFMNNIEGIEHEVEDITFEESNLNNIQQVYVKPSVEIVTKKLIDQGITTEDLVKVLLRDYPEYDSDEDSFEAIDDIIYDKLCNIISNYKHDEVNIQTDNQSHIDYTSQEKEYINVISQQMIL